MNTFCMKQANRNGHTDYDTLYCLINDALFEKRKNLRIRVP